MPLPRLALLTSLIALGVLSRLIPHPPNFTAIGAASVFAGAMLERRFLPWLIPLSALLISDALIGFHSFMPSVYFSLAAIVTLSRRLTPGSGWPRFAGFSVLSSVFFYLVTNFEVWRQGGWYAPTASGLLACYGAGLPFLWSALGADLLYLGLMVSLLRLAENRSPFFRDTSAAGLAPR